MMVGNLELALDKMRVYNIELALNLWWWPDNDGWQPRTRVR